MFSRSRVQGLLVLVLVMKESSKGDSYPLVSDYTFLRTYYRIPIQIYAIEFKCYHENM